MALADWDFVKTPAGVAAAILDGRLKVDNLATRATNQNNYATLRLSSSFPRGHLIGKVRTLMEVVDHPIAGNGDGFHGVVCMMSQSDLTAGAGSCYCFGMRLVQPATFFVDWVLAKFTAGLANASATVGNVTLLGSGDTTLTPERDVVYAIELQWTYHSLIQGVSLIARVGRGENHFADLTTVYDLTDSSSPLTTSVGEGLFYNDSDGQSSNDLKTTMFDDTSIIPLTGMPL